MLRIWIILDWLELESFLEYNWVEVSAAFEAFEKRLIDELITELVETLNNNYLSYWSDKN